jgi:hypothetical protein
MWTHVTIATNIVKTSRFAAQLKVRMPQHADGHDPLAQCSIFEKSDDEQLQASVLRIAITVCADEQVAQAFSAVCPAQNLVLIASQHSLSLRPLYDQLAALLPKQPGRNHTGLCREGTAMTCSANNASPVHSHAFPALTPIPRVPALRSQAGDSLLQASMRAPPGSASACIPVPPVGCQQPTSCQPPERNLNSPSPLLAPVLSGGEPYCTPELPAQAKYLSASVSLSQGISRGHLSMASSCASPAMLQHSFAINPPSADSSAKASTGFTMPHPSPSMLFSAPAPVHSTKV